MKRLNFSGFLIGGGIRETQEMLDFCAKHIRKSGIELIKAEDINKAYDRLRRRCKIPFRDRHSDDIAVAMKRRQPDARLRRPGAGATCHQRTSCRQPYTLQNETDPMATGGGTTPARPAFDDVPPPVNRGEAIIAPPPPGADSLPTQDVAPITATPPQYRTQYGRYPAPAAPANNAPDNPYPNTGSGRSARRPQWCTRTDFLHAEKPAFGSMGSGLHPTATRSNPISIQISTS